VTETTDSLGLLDPEMLARPIRGTALKGATLGEELGGRRTLLCYLRHLG